MDFTPTSEQQDAAELAKRILAAALVTRTGLGGEAAVPGVAPSPAHASALATGSARNATTARHAAARPLVTAQPPLSRLRG